VIDSQWGSCGKGRVESAIYQRFAGRISAGVSDNLPNAGHTITRRDGGAYEVLKALPVASRWLETSFLGPHSAYYLEQLQKELDLAWSGHTVFADYLSSPLMPGDEKKEQALVSSIASTGQGSSLAITRKVGRGATGCDGTLAEYLEEVEGDWCLAGRRDFVPTRTAPIIQNLVSKSVVLLEGSQGFDLSLNHGHQYPHVTSRDVTPNRMLDNAGLSFRDCSGVLGLVRTFPIRVGNVGEASSGPCYPDQQELLWTQVSEAAGRPVEERTTVTNRVRRVFTFSEIQFSKFIRQCRPTMLAVTFGDYLSEQALGDFVSRLEMLSGVPVVMICRGPSLEDTEWRI
jgi:adenylosuccinate synthase